ncbi:DUF3006 domain-containing protein [Candidatus Dependentiae bacterium]|nr:DUF3006 domain-containing protein [Candidatus Dependentiae bacterium]
MEKKIQVIVDRIEENIAVIELPDSSETIEIDKKYLPSKIKEGNVIDIIFKINKEEESARLKEISDLQQELLNRNKK